MWEHREETEKSEGGFGAFGEVVKNLRNLKKHTAGCEDRRGCNELDSTAG